MALRKGIVVATHPRDHSVDLVMVDNYARLVGVQVLSSSGSSRTGSVNLPEVRDRPNKWDISTVNSQEIMATVDWVGRVPVVTGFIFPQISQMTFDDPTLEFYRHTSDVIRYTDGEGNHGLLHPSGAYITMGQSPDRRNFSGSNYDKNLAVDRNTGTKPYFRIGMAGNVIELTFTPEGKAILVAQENVEVTCLNATVTASQNINATCKEATVTASDGILLDTPQTHLTGALHVDGAITTNSTVKSDGDQMAGNISQTGHRHPNIKRGEDVSDGPQ
ncbi:baseplate assembly protein [Yersinia phage fHe-Yen8-01]|nr:baseplate assembly protein [Yersinia phage fHe-Yen8-01]